jgi:pyrimidine operon attenuation protein/uracil phosphoribosyltransferase
MDAFVKHMKNPPEKNRIIFGEAEIEKAVDKIYQEILERHLDMSNLGLVGIRTGGKYIADRIRKRIKDAKGIDIPVGIVDITLYRDDWTRMSQHPGVKSTDIPFPLEDTHVVLVDDVLFTGRTIRAALDALMDYGRPKRIELAVLIDRGHREFPIKADYIGIDLPTSPHESVNVYLKEIAQFDSVTLEADKYP